MHFCLYSNVYLFIFNQKVNYLCVFSLFTNDFLFCIYLHTISDYSFNLNSSKTCSPSCRRKIRCCYFIKKNTSYRHINLLGYYTHKLASLSWVINAGFLRGGWDITHIWLRCCFFSILHLENQQRNILMKSKKWWMNCYESIRSSAARLKLICWRPAGPHLFCAWYSKRCVL